MTRGGVFANNRTGNMSKLGIMLAMGNWEAAIQCFIPILACILGASSSEFVRYSFSKRFDWRRISLLMEALALLSIAFVPENTADTAVTTGLSFIAGFQLCLFRSCEYGAHNTTICTGNLRSVGQYFLLQ